VRLKYLQPIAVVFPEEQREQQGKFSVFSAPSCLPEPGEQADKVHTSRLCTAIATAPPHGLRSCTSSLLLTLNSLVQMDGAMEKCIIILLK